MKRLPLLAFCAVCADAALAERFLLTSERERAAAQQQFSASYNLDSCLTALAAGDNPNVALAQLLRKHDPELAQLGAMATPAPADAAEPKKDVSLVHLAMGNERAPPDLVTLFCSWRPFWATMCDNW